MLICVGKCKILKMSHNTVQKCSTLFPVAEIDLEDIMLLHRITLTLSFT